MCMAIGKIAAGMSPVIKAYGLPPEPPKDKTLNRRDAEARLALLKPGTVEQLRLQDVLVRNAIGIQTIDTPSGSYKVYTGRGEEQLLGGFGTSEHVKIGDGVRLGGLGSDGVLIRKGLAELTFGHIIAMAGDYYGVPNGAISLLGGDAAAKKERFWAAFNTLTGAPDMEVYQVLLEVRSECAEIAQSSLPHHCYSHGLMERNDRMKRIKDNIDALLIDNSDHFFNNAKDAYTVGHGIALEVAAQAGAVNDIEGLRRAYAIDAFACHFLTDLFSAGHVRNQRGELELYLKDTLHFSPALSKKFAGLLAGAQHETDGKGLDVRNGLGETWGCYGDGHFFTSKNTDNGTKAVQAAQQSADEVYEAYRRETPTIENKVSLLMPVAIDANPEPVYRLEGGQLYIQGHQEAIISQDIFITQGLNLALSKLPDDYVDGFIMGQFNALISKGVGHLEAFSKHIDSYVPGFYRHCFTVPRDGLALLGSLAQKVVVPQVDKFTDLIWRLVGLPSHLAFQQQGHQIDQKLDEIGAALGPIYTLNQQVLTTVNGLTKKVDQLQQTVERIAITQKWNDHYLEIRESVASILDMCHQLEQVSDLDYIRNHASVMQNAYVRISRVLSSATTSQDVNILEVLTEYQRQRAGVMDTEDSIKLAVTLWYRHIVDLQVRAFSLYFTSIADNPTKDSRAISMAFIKSISDQERVCTPYIDVDLASQSMDYILLQQEKHQMQLTLQSYLS
jgi:hypothetical protein